MSDKKDTSTLFNRIAKHYDRFNFLASFGIEKIWRKKIKTLFIPKGDILDLGCGIGELSEIINDDKCSVIGVDPAINMLKIGKKKGYDLKFINGYGENLPFKDNSFDFIISAFVFRNLKDIDKTLSEIKRVLKHGGELIILDFFWPENYLLSFFFTQYLKNILPFIYKILGGNPHDIKHLYFSIKNFYNIKNFKLLLKSHEFDNIRYLNLSFNLARYFIIKKG
jgi:demethylmenaquinone methyltransferase/2-methoxy-6-polyprenyl-1,4-benzoquinol methylase